MTLSVGMRAPSARELINEIAEHTSTCFSNHLLAKRYDDPLLCASPNEISRAEISLQTRENMRHLVRDALNQVIENDSIFDEILGKLLTEPKRLRINYPVSLNPEKDVMDTELSSILNLGMGSLHHCNSICFAYSEFMNQNIKICRLFVDGNKWEVSSDGSDQQETEISMMKTIATEKRLSRENFLDSNKETKGVPTRILDILHDLLQRGYLKVAP